MKNPSFISRRHSKTLTTFPNRAKLQSLRVPRKQTEPDQTSTLDVRLEQGLKIHTIQESCQLVDFDLVLPDAEEHVIEDRLWQYFVQRMSRSQYKVEREQVNCRERQFQGMRELITKKQKMHTVNLTSLTSRIKDKNKGIHYIFLQLTELKLPKATISLSGNGIGLTAVDNGDQVRQLKGKVESCRREIVGFERELGSEQEELKRLDREWLSLLVKMVQGGYFMSDGMRGVFREMGRNGYIPKQGDFPSFMDSVSIKCMLKVYNLVMKEEQEKKTRQRIVSCYQPRQVSTSIRSIRQIAKQPKLKQIYQGTKDYITTWLRNENWREESHLKQLPAIATKALLSSDEVKEEWQSEQRRRMKIVYRDKLQLRLTLNMMFGPRVELLP